MNSHEEALDMVNYYEQHPAALYGKPIAFYLSKRLQGIEVMAAIFVLVLCDTVELLLNVPRTQTLTVFCVLTPQKDERSSDRSMDRPVREVKGHGSQVVFFSNLPREEEKKKELLTIAGRFGIVEKHLFLTDQVNRETFNQVMMRFKSFAV